VKTIDAHGILWVIISGITFYFIGKIDLTLLLRIIFIILAGYLTWHISGWIISFPLIYQKFKKEEK